MGAMLPMCVVAGVGSVGGEEVLCLVVGGTHCGRGGVSGKAVFPI